MAQPLEANRDFRNWDLYDHFTIFEASLLWVGIDPHQEFDELPETEYQTIRSALIAALRDGQIEGEVRGQVEEVLDPTRTRSDSSVVELAETGADDWDESILFRSSLVAWARSKGAKPVFLQRDLAQDSEDAEKYQRTLSLECPEHLTPWVRLMLQAYEEFWQAYDPNDTNLKSPSNAEVADWLMKRKVTGVKVPQDAAKVIARIIRPADAPTGRRRDTDDEKYGV